MERASLISSSDRGIAKGSGLRLPILGRGSLGGKKLSSSALLIVTGSEGRGREGNLGVFLGGDQLFGCPYVVRGGFGQPIGPIEGLRSLYGLEIAQPGLSFGVEGSGGL